MFLLRLMTIACLAIALLIIFFSNLTPELSLVFLGNSTVPISLGTLVLGAFGWGFAISLILRILMFGQQPRRRSVTEPAEFSHEPSAPTTDDWEKSRPNRDIIDETPNRKKNKKLAAPEPANPEQFKYVPPTDSVYDANYRVISQPRTRNAPPDVGSKLRSDSEDWGFDFEDEDAPKK
jgi:hypothetical protein